VIGRLGRSEPHPSLKNYFFFLAAFFLAFFAVFFFAFLAITSSSG
jgi:hypothetical protein